MAITSINPSDYQVIGEVEETSQVELKEMFEAAASAQPAWAAFTLEERIQQISSLLAHLDSRAEDLATVFSQEMGMPIANAIQEVKGSIASWASVSDLARQALAPTVVHETDTERHTSHHEPVGIVSAIGPWNFPFSNAYNLISQVVVAGNAVIYKPSEETVLFAKLLGECIAESDFPDGVMSIVVGGRETGQALAEMPSDLMLFTGSTATGQKVTEFAAKNSTPVLTELGGSAPGVVFADADIPRIAETLYESRFANTGQYCDNLKRLIVEESSLDEVLAALKSVNDQRKVGPASEDVNYGPLVAERQLVKLEEQVKDAMDKGANVEFGGQGPDGLTGAYYLPTVLTNITKDMRVWQEEVFGPVLPVVTFTTESEAIELANDTPYGLGAYVFTEDKDKYLRVAKGIDSGNIAHNNVGYFNEYCPFGGFKGSGNTRNSGLEGFREVTQIKTISEEK